MEKHLIAQVQGKAGQAISVYSLRRKLPVVWGPRRRAAERMPKIKGVDRMEKVKVQRCPNCRKFFRHGEWFIPDKKEQKEIATALYAGKIEMVHAPCESCCEGN